MQTRPQLDSALSMYKICLYHMQNTQTSIRVIIPHVSIQLFRGRRGVLKVTGINPLDSYIGTAQKEFRLCQLCNGFGGEIPH